MAPFYKELTAIYVINSLFVMLLILAQAREVKKGRLPERGSLIPGTQQKFLYVQDWYTLKWGDTIAIPLILNAFLYLVRNGKVETWEWILLLIVSNVVSAGFLGIICLSPDHKPDYGTWPIGHQTLPGLIHVPYFGVCLTVGIASICHLIAGHFEKGGVLYLGLAGAVIYITTFIIDMRLGNFASLHIQK